jgi:hypothetical protein
MGELILLKLDQHSGRPEHHMAMNLRKIASVWNCGGLNQVL